ncbi:MAG: hypothetical protein U9R19_09060 [Bacteroidota bacterium]|nr:hypothetical protein [Bacteroidota bacterium]
MNKFELIDNFLMGRLDEQEMQSVKDRISTDTEFAETVAEHMKIIKLIRVHEENKIRRKFSELDETQNTGKQVKKVYMIRTLAVAASISLILISYFAFFSNSFNKIEGNEIASNMPYVCEYLQPPINYFMQRSRGRSEENKLSDAMLLYDNQQYKQASIIFDELLLTDSNKVNVLFYGGVSYAKSNQPKKALECFMETETKENIFSQELQWYKSLIYLDTGEIEKAKELLYGIINSESKYQKDAELILLNIK